MKITRSSENESMLKAQVHVRTGLIEFIAVIFNTLTIGYLPILQQYIYNRILREKSEPKYTLSWSQGSLPDNDSESNICYNVSSGHAEVEAQAESATWLLYIGLVSALPSIFSTLIIGAITDLRGRKFGLIISSVGCMIKTLIAMLVIKLNWPIFVLLIGGFVDGCLGSFGTALMAAFAYLADITQPGKARALRITIIEALSSFVGSAAYLGVGYLIKEVGYFYPMLIVFLLFVICTVLIVFCLPETLKCRADVSVLGCSRLTSTFKTYFKPRETSKRAQLLLLAASFLLFETVMLSKNVIDTLYQMGFPFCWQSVTLGIYVAVTSTIQVLSMLIFVRPLTKYMHENIVSMVGLMSTIGELVMVGLANSGLLLFIAGVVGLFIMMPISMIKSACSRLVGREEQGSLFAGISSIQMFCLTFGNSLYTAVYSSTVQTFPGLVFLLMAFIIFLSFGLIGVAEILRHKSNSSALYVPILPHEGER